MKKSIFRTVFAFLVAVGILPTMHLNGFWPEDVIEAYFENLSGKKNSDLVSQFQKIKESLSKLDDGVDLLKSNCPVKQGCIRVPARGNIPAAKIFFKMQGESKKGNPTLVFIHGTALSSDSWLCQQAAFCKDFQTISLDLRGSGRSQQTDPRLIQYSMEVFADDIHAVLQKLGINEFVYVGHSLGAGLGIFYSARYPGEITKLVLVSGDPLLFTPDCAASPTCTTPPCPTCWPFPAFTVSSLVAATEFVDTFGPVSFAITEASTTALNESCQSELVNAQGLLVTQVIQTGFPIFVNIVVNADATDLRSLLNGISVPTLICVGSIDATVPPGASFYMNTQIPHSILAEFIGKGHFLMQTDYRAFNKLLRKFVNDKKLPAFQQIADPCVVCPLLQPTRFDPCL